MNPDDRSIRLKYARIINGCSSVLKSNNNSCRLSNKSRKLYLSAIRKTSKIDRPLAALFSDIPVIRKAAILIILILPRRSVAMTPSVMCSKTESRRRRSKSIELVVSSIRSAKTFTSCANLPTSSFVRTTIPPE